MERLRAATQSDAQKIATAAKAEIEAAERAARLELKALAANLAVDGAESLLAKQLTPKAQESLISNFVKRLGREAKLKSASLQYANALADIALAQGAGDPAAKQLNEFGAAYAQSAELRTFLASPAVSIEDKHAVIEKIVARLGASKIIRNFLFVLADHGARS